MTCGSVSCPSKAKCTVHWNDIMPMGTQKWMDGWMDSYKCSAGAQQQEPKSSRANARMHQYHKRFYYMQHLQQSKLMHQPNGQEGQNANSSKVVGTVWHGYLQKKCHLEVSFNGLDRGRPLLRLTLSFPWPEAHLDIVFCNWLHWANQRTPNFSLGWDLSLPNRALLSPMGKLCAWVLHLCSG